MRDYQISVAPFGYVALHKISIDKQTGEHGKAFVSMCIADSQKEVYLAKLLEREHTWVSIGAVGETGERRTVFYGIVYGFDFKSLPHETVLDLELVSGSYLWDIRNHFRVFQDPGMTYMDIIGLLKEGYPESAVFSSEKQVSPLNHVVIQHKETDWELVKRLASEDYQILVPESWKKGSKYWIGLPEGRQRHVENEAKLEVTNNIGVFQERLRNGLADLQLPDMLELSYMSREIYEMGDWIGYKGQRYYIHKTASRYTGDELVHTYYFKTKKGLRNLPFGHNRHSGCSFEATVAAVRKDEVRITVHGDESAGRTAMHWFTYGTVYSSPDGTGWYCMPEVGDQVRLYVPDDEAGSFVLSSVHMETAASRQNPEHKSFKTKYGKEVLFTPDTLIMTNNKGLMIELSDEKGISIVSDKDIVMQAEKNITISSQSAALLLAAQDSLQVKQGDGTTMTLKEDIVFTGGEFRVQ